MNITLDHDPAEDFGALIIKLDRDDYAEMSGHGRDMKIRLPLYSHEAREIVERLQPLAAAPDPDQHLDAPLPPAESPAPTVPLAFARQMRDALLWFSDFAAEHPEWEADQFPPNTAERDWLDRCRALIDQGLPPDEGPAPSEPQFVDRPTPPHAFIPSRTVGQCAGCIFPETHPIHENPAS